MKPAVPSILEYEPLDQKSNGESSPVDDRDKTPEVSEKLSPQEEYVRIVNEDFSARDRVYDAGVAIRDRLQYMAGKLWGAFTSKDESVRSKAEATLTPERVKYLFDNDKELQAREEEESDAKINAAMIFVKERKFEKIPGSEKALSKKEIRVGRIDGIVGNMVMARARWIELAFEKDTKEVAPEMNRLTKFQFDEMDRLKTVYGSTQAIFDYKTCELQKNMLRDKLYDYFNTTTSQEREDLDRGFRTALDYPSDRLRDIFHNHGMTIDKKIELAMSMNNQDKRMEYLKSVVVEKDPSLMVLLANEN